MLSIRDIRDMSDCIQITEDNSSINTAILLPSARVGCLFNDSKAQDIVSRLLIYTINIY